MLLYLPAIYDYRAIGYRITDTVSHLFRQFLKADRSQKNVYGRDTGQESISDRVMRPALSEQCPKGAANLVPLAAAPERKRVTLDPVRCHGPLTAFRKPLCRSQNVPPEPTHNGTTNQNLAQPEQ